MSAARPAGTRQHGSVTESCSRMQAILRSALFPSRVRLWSVPASPSISKSATIFCPSLCWSWISDPPQPISPTLWAAGKWNSRQREKSRWEAALWTSSFWRARCRIRPAAARSARSSRRALHGAATVSLRQEGSRRSILPMRTTGERTDADSR